MSDVAFSPDGRWLSTGSDRDGEMFLWSTATWERVAAIKPSRQCVFQPAGDMLATVEPERNAIQLWDIEFDRAIDILGATLADQPAGGRGFIFISHSSLDRPLVSANIIEPLRSAGVPTWYSERNIQATAEWERSIHGALQSCAWFLVVLSPQSIQSKWVRTEVAWAVSHRRGRIIPVLIDSCNAADLHLHLAELQSLDFRIDPEHAGRELVEFLMDKSVRR